MENKKNWSELDQIAVRKNIHDLIQYEMPENGYQDRVKALSQLRSIVNEEVARGFYMVMSHDLEVSPKDDALDAKKLVNRISSSLDELGLASQHPRTGEPMKLTMAKTPPKHGESWLQLESFHSRPGSFPERLPRPIPNLRPCAAPDIPHGQSKGSLLR